MNPLDDSILDVLATVVCGDLPGLKYRKGHEIAPFFKRAGLECQPHDGSTRKWWTLERLREFNAQAGAVKRIVLRLSEPREYPNDPGALNETIKHLNGLLAVDGYKVELRGTSPQLVKTDATVPESLSQVRAAIPVPNLSVLCSGDATVLPLLEARWKETNQCLDAAAWLSAIVMMGGLLEGLLLAMMLSNPKQANTASAAPRDPSTGKIRSFPEWKLHEMIEVAHQVGWIAKDAKDFSNVLRQYRNLIHPYEQRSCQFFPDEDTSRICWLVVVAAVNDLVRFHAKK